MIPPKTYCPLDAVFVLAMNDCNAFAPRVCSVAVEPEAGDHSIKLCKAFCASLRSESSAVCVVERFVEMILFELLRVCSRPF